MTCRRWISSVGFAACTAALCYGLSFISLTRFAFIHFRLNNSFSTRSLFLGKSNYFFHIHKYIFHFDNFYFSTLQLIILHKTYKHFIFNTLLIILSTLSSLWNFSNYTDFRNIFKCLFRRRIFWVLKNFLSFLSVLFNYFWLLIPYPFKPKIIDFLLF